MAGQNPSQATTLTATNGKAGGTVTLGGTHFWGTPVTGVNTPAATAAGVPNATILLDGATPLSSANVSISPASLDFATGVLTAGGNPSGTVTLPNNLSAGTPRSLTTVVQANGTPYDGNAPAPLGGPRLWRRPRRFTVAGSDRDRLACHRAGRHCGRHLR